MMAQTTKERRRAPTLAERITPCDCCKWPLTHRHHLLFFGKYGETAHTMQLCASCHELFHLAYAAMFTPSERINELWMAFVRCVGSRDYRITYMLLRVAEVHDLECQYWTDTIENEPQLDDYEIEELGIEESDAL